MELLFKQRLFSWFDSYDIYDEQENTLFTVEGQFAWGHKLHIYNRDYVHVGTVRQQFSLLPRFELYEGEQHLGDIRKEFTFFNPVYTLNCNDWTIYGDPFGWNYSVETSSGACVATVSKEIFHLSDTYVIDVPNEEHALLVLMIVLAIDAATCAHNN